PLLPAPPPPPLPPSIPLPLSAPLLPSGRTLSILSRPSTTIEPSLHRYARGLMPPLALSNPRRSMREPSVTTAGGRRGPAPVPALFPPTPVAAAGLATARQRCVRLPVSPPPPPPPPNGRTFLKDRPRRGGDLLRDSLRSSPPPTPHSCDGEAGGEQDLRGAAAAAAGSTAAEGNSHPLLLLPLPPSL
ncbi:unnamed protein product, partial [Ectocarpus sp. 12 AP-2014]